MKTFHTNEARPKFNPVKTLGHQQLAVSVNEAAQRITDANLHGELKWLRNERNKFEQQVEVKHDFLVTQAHRQVDPAQQQAYVQFIDQIYTELKNMYTQLEQINVAIHNKQLHMTGKVA
jgi:hypothetical protein